MLDLRNINLLKYANTTGIVQNQSYTKEHNSSRSQCLGILVGRIFPPKPAPADIGQLCSQLFP